MNYQFPQPYQVVKVNGERGAEALPMYPRSEVIALDASCTDKILAWYITTDDAGCKTKTLYKMDIYKAWNAAMVNEDGSIGGHWSISDTSPLMRDTEINVSSITPEIWNTTMNMMYSDYCGVARHYGVDIPEFYGSLAKAFLLDKDGPKPTKKLAEYYKHIVV